MPTFDPRRALRRVMLGFSAASLSALALAACSDDSAGTVPAPSGPDASADAARPPRPDASGGSSDDCDERARWIYLVDGDNALLRYEPDRDVITPIGTLACAAGAAPFSMAVDRNAFAYVLHGDHRIYRVSTADASCSPTSYRPDQIGVELFGMGFVADGTDSSAETLYIAGGPESELGGGSSLLAELDVATWRVSIVAEVGGSPELTGNADGALWGFFPDSFPMSVRQIDRGTGGTLREIDVSDADPPGSEPRAWAFAYWGGRYYVFYQSSVDDSTAIWRVTPGTPNTVERVRANIGYQIVGAGVSTCAPTILI